MGEHRQVFFARPVFVGEQHRCGAVGQRRAVAGGHRAGFALVENGFELGQLFEGRIAAHVVVGFRAVERHDQVLVPACVIGGRGFGMAGICELVLVLTLHVPAFGDDLGALAHRQTRARLENTGKLGKKM